jgi:hypothetical protein
VDEFEKLLKDSLHGWTGKPVVPILGFPHGSAHGWKWSQSFQRT